SEIDRVLADAVNADPSSAPARVARVNYLLATDRAKEALDAALSAQSAIPDDMRVLESLAQAQKANNNFSQAVVTFGKLAALLPRSPGPLIGQAEAYIADKDWIGARGALQKAVALNPNDASNQLFLINTIAGSGQPDAARAAARALQKAQPKSAMGYIAEAGVFSSQGQSAEAENVLRSAMKTVDEPVLAIQLVGLLLRDKRTKDAEAVVSQWTEKHPKDQTVRLAVAEASLSAKNFELSSRMYRSLLRGAPDDPVFMNNLAWALGQTGDPEALSLAVKAAAKAPSNPAILETLGQLQLSAGESAKAIQTLTKATELAPANAVLRLSLARAHAKLGQKNEARAQIEIIRNLIAPATVRQDADALLKTL
ncbi:MAG: tetratricopeptide repeat protein, partial [Burkholderiales bacterium]|nr:tetratricopeptide repeat protein [Burkholderiales bacterium]